LAYPQSASIRTEAGVLDDISVDRGEDERSAIDALIKGMAKPERSVLSQERDEEPPHGFASKDVSR
jgi:hypothetical protein